MLVSKRKRYLSGSDWGINTLDHMMKAATCSGNMSQIVLMLKAPLDEREVRDRLNQFTRQFPVLQGRVARDWKFAPYWKIPATVNGDVSLSVSTLDEVSFSSLLGLLTKSANSRFRDDTEHIAFHLFTNSKRSALAMTFDHRLFDARGAESFLNLFQQSLLGKAVSGDIAFRSTHALTRWKDKFLAGQQVNRRIIALSQSRPEALAVQGDLAKGFRYKLICFSEQETTAIYDKAYQEAGYLLESPYFLSVITHAMHKLFTRVSGDGSSYLIPVTMDLRPGLDTLQEIFFNHVSYLFYQIPVQEAGELKGLIASFKQQMYDQVKANFPKNLAAASLLARIVPLGLFGKLIRFPVQGKIASFAYSHLGKSFYQADEFMGRSIENIVHMPRVPLPPGLGFFSNYYKNRLNLVISYWDGLLSDNELRMIETEIRASFGVG